MQQFRLGCEHLTNRTAEGSLIIFRTTQWENNFQKTKTAGMKTTEGERTESHPIKSIHNIWSIKTKEGVFKDC